MKRALENTLLKAFPVPYFLEMPAVGLDVSDSTIKFIEFVRERGAMRVGRFGEKRVPAGVVVSGEIKQPDKLSHILTELREEHGLYFIRASLPEEKGYLFETTAPRVDPQEIRSSLGFKLEENVPLKRSSAIFDYDVIGNRPTKKSGREVEVVVSVFPTEDVQSYVDPFKVAGLVPLSLEIEAQALAHAIIPRGDFATYMIVDYGRARSGISLVSGGVVRFATTIEVGGDAATQALSEAHPDVSPEEITQLKNKEGIRGTPPGSLQKAVQTFVDEVSKYAVYWQTHDVTGSSSASDQGSIKKVFLCGGNANMAGLPEYISRALGIPVERANVWTNAFSLDTYVPPIPFNESLGFASAIGLALHHEHY